MVNKIFGYVLAILGIVGVAIYTIPQFKSLVSLPVQISPTILFTVSIVLAVVGIYIIAKGGRRNKVREVPIMAGKDVVGYRVVKGR